MSRADIGQDSSRIRGFSPCFANHSDSKSTLNPLQTDLKRGKNAGCATAVVLTGVSRRAGSEALPQMSNLTGSACTAALGHHHYRTRIPASSEEGVPNPVVPGASQHRGAVAVSGR